MTSSRVLNTLVGAALFFFTHQSHAAVLNVDFEARDAGDRTHLGDDGVLSNSGGTVWNGVPFDTNLPGLVDEDGFSTSVSFQLTDFPAGQLDVDATNDLQDSGMTNGGFRIVNLNPGETYRLAIYVGFNTGFGVIDQNGGTPNICSGIPTYNLPGVAGPRGIGPVDYCLFTGLIPFDTGNGVFGIEVTTLDGLITGFQLAGSLAPVDLAVTQQLSASSPPIPAPGDDVVFDITVTNLSTEDAIDVMLTDVLPAGVTFDPSLSSTDCSESSGTVTCDLGDIAGGNATTAPDRRAVG